MNPAGAEVSAVPAGLVYSAKFRRGGGETAPVHGAKFTAWPAGHKVKTELGNRLIDLGIAPRSGGTRGAIKGFTPKARRLLRQTLAEVDSAAAVLFTTLTYPSANSPDPDRLKMDLERFGKRFKREFPEGAFCWVLEHHKSGVPHLHLLVWGAEYRALRAWAPTAWYEACKTGNPAHLRAGTRVEFPRAGHGLSEYLSKYTSKGRAVGNADGQAWGRWWGVIRRSAIPWAAAEEHAIPFGVAVRVMRWQRKAGTPVTPWHRKRNGWARPAHASKARFTISRLSLPSLTRVGPPGPWLRALGLAWAAELEIEHAPYSGFGAWARAH